MICPNCGKEIDDASVTCKFCGKNLMNNKSNFQPDLISDRYGIDKSVIYKESNEPKEKKGLGMLIIGLVLLVILIIAALIMLKK